MIKNIVIWLQHSQLEIDLLKVSMIPKFRIQFKVKNLFKDVKRVYYLSLEFLLGRHMQNALVNLGVESEYKDALMKIGY